MLSSLSKIHRKVDHLSPGIVATFHPVENIQLINRRVFDTLSSEQQAAVYRREETVYTDDFILISKTDYETAAERSPRFMRFYQA